MKSCGHFFRPFSAPNKLRLLNFHFTIRLHRICSSRLLTEVANDAVAGASETTQPMQRQSCNDSLVVFAVVIYFVFRDMSVLILFVRGSSLTDIGVADQPLRHVTQSLASKFYYSDHRMSLAHCFPAITDGVAATQQWKKSKSSVVRNVLLFIR